MKRIIFIFFLFFSYLFSYDVYLNKNNNQYYDYVYFVNGIDWSSSLCDVDENYVIDGVNRYNTTRYNFPNQDTNFVACINHYVSFSCGNAPEYVYHLSQSNYDYCLNNWSGNTFSDSVGYYITPDNQVVCPEGFTYDYDIEDCVPVPECPTSDELDSQAIDKCGSLNWVSYESCNPDTGVVTITCKSCIDITQGLIDYCSPSAVKDNVFSCSENSDGSIVVNISQYTTDLCVETNDTINPPDENTTDTDDTNLTSDTQDNTSDSNTETDDSNSDSSTDSNTDSSSDTNNTCPDPCSVYKDIGVQVTSSTVSDYTCFTITYPTYDGCTLQYHTSDNTASGPNCVPGCSTTTITNNVTTSVVTADVSGIEQRLDSLNSKLDEFKNMTPDSNFTVEGSDDDTDSFISQFGDFFNNVGNDITKIKDSFSQVLGMLKEDNYKLTVFNSDATTCPISASIFGKDFNADFCSFILPFRPLLSIFFTVVFNFLVIKYFLKLVISKEDK